MDDETAVLDRPRTLPRDERLRLWSIRWADPALQALGLWLDDHGVQDHLAVHAVAKVWSLYGYAVVPAYQGYPRMALSAASEGTAREILIHLRPPATLSAEEVTALRRTLEAARRDAFGRTPIPGVAARLDVADGGAGFEAIQTAALLAGRDFLGVYVDDLRGELSRVMNPSQLDRWLQQPNETLAGKRPADLLGDPDHDRFLRDLVLDVTYSLVA